MKKSKICLLVLVLSSFCCSLVDTGVIVYQPPTTEHDRQQFIQHFQQTNLEREKAGLAPLDLCTEKYNFDRGWAMKDPNCKKRILAYEAGDKNALGTPQLGEKKDKE